MLGLLEERASLGSIWVKERTGAREVPPRAPLSFLSPPLTTTSNRPLRRLWKNPKHSRVVTVDSCFTIIVAYQYVATNREALLKITECKLIKGGHTFGLLTVTPTLACVASVSSRVRRESCRDKSTFFFHAITRLKTLATQATQHSQNHASVALISPKENTGWRGQNHEKNKKDIGSIK